MSTITYVPSVEMINTAKSGGDMTIRFRIAALVGSVAIVGASLAGCSSGTASSPSSSAASSSSATSKPTATASDYGAATEQAFVEGCEQSSAGSGLSASEIAAYCGCTYRGLAAKIPFADYAAADAAVDTTGSDGVPEAMKAIGATCKANPSAY